MAAPYAPSIQSTLKSPQNDTEGVDVGLAILPLEIPPRRDVVLRWVDGCGERGTKCAVHFPGARRRSKRTARTLHLVPQLLMRDCVGVDDAEPGVARVGLKQHRGHWPVQLRSNQRQYSERALEVGENRNEAAPGSR